MHIDPSWQEPLQGYLTSDAYTSMIDDISQRRADGRIILPPENDVYNALSLTPWSAVRVVILGQDPYHRIGQAMGLSFSVQRGISIPPSLRNIYKELSQDVGCHTPDHGDLTAWARQGVLLLNAILTVEAGKAGSHESLGWQRLTDTIIKALSDKKQGIIFLLWGNFAKSKAPLIDATKHHILEAAHPSPLARGAFFGSKHFSKTNDLLIRQGKKPIRWQID